MLIDLLADAGSSGRYCQRRLFEWIASLALLGIGIEILLLPDILPSSSLYRITWLLPTMALGLAVSLIGAVRIFCLLINGQWPIAGPVLRSIGCLLGAALWSQMTVAVGAQLITGDQPRPVLSPLFIVLALGELISTLRAATDVRIRRRQAV